MRARPRSRQDGFTLMEIMMSMLVLVIGLLGIVALNMTTVKGNRQSRTLDRAVDVLEQMMEDLRGRSADASNPNSIVSCAAAWHSGCPNYPDDITTSDGVTYHRSYTVAPVPGQGTLVLVTASVSYPDDQNTSPDAGHRQSMQMIRTTMELL
jgi:type IV pilus assembly protein PilV